MIHEGYQNFTKTPLLFVDRNISRKNMDELFFGFWSITYINQWRLSKLLRAISHIFPIIIVLIFAERTIYI